MRKSVGSLIALNRRAFLLLGVGLSLAAFGVMAWQASAHVNSKLINFDSNKQIAAPAASPTNEGVFLSRAGTISTIALSGQTVAGVGTLSPQFDGPTFNNNSTVAFTNKGITGGSATAAVFLKKINGPLTVIAKTGDAAPVPGGELFSRL